MTLNESSEKNVLGVIIPALRPGNQPREIINGECHYYGRWAKKFGVESLEAREELTVSPGSHFIDSSFETGSLDVLVPAAQKLANDGCKVLAWACTCGSFVGGIKWAETQMEALTKATGLPATSTSLSMIAAIKEFGADTVDLISPYPPRLTSNLLGFLQESNIYVAALVTLSCLEPEESDDLELRSEVKKFDKILAKRSHPLVIPDTAISAIGLIPQLEKDIKRPIIAANQATLWNSLNLMNIPVRTKEGGSLFSRKQF